MGILSGIIGSIGDIAAGIGTNITNSQIAKQNLAFERENLEYQKELQNKIFDREDTAYQRTVNDMRSAGLNPLTMKGTNSAGTAIQTIAPQNKYVADPVSFNNAMNTISGISSVIADNRQKNAQTELINAQKTGQDIANNTAEEIATKEIEKLQQEINSIRENTQGSKLDNYDKEKRNDNSERYHKETLRSLTANTDTTEYELEEKRKTTKENKDFWNMLGLDSRIDPQAKDLAIDIMQSTGFVPDAKKSDAGYVGAAQRTMEQERRENRHGVRDNVIGLVKDAYNYGSNILSTVYNRIRKSINSKRKK